MSTATKTIGLVVVIVVFATLGWHYIGQDKELADGNDNTIQNEVYVPSHNANVQTVQKTNAEINTDTSDSALEKDSAEIDVEMDGLDKDSSDTDSRINDKQVN